LLESVRPIHDLVVVNNDRESTLRRDPSWPNSIRIIETGDNLGFSGGMNAGIRAALKDGAEHVLLLNSDATVEPDCIERLGRCLALTPNAGIVGPVVVTRSNPSIVESLGMEYSERSGRMRLKGAHVPVASLDLPKSSVVDAVTGCCMLISRGVFDAIGLLDQDYFFSFEDLDFCLRARNAGFATVLSGTARVAHEGAQSIGVGSPRRLYFAARNHLLVAKRTASNASPVMCAARSMSIVALNLAHAVAATGGSTSARIAAVVHGTSDYVAGRFGADSDARTHAHSATATTAPSVAETL
jgi:GT2 family glycosyltransferase